MANFYIHSGLNRCFTQFFRSHVFPNLPKTIHYLREDDSLSIIIHKLVNQEIQLTKRNRDMVKNLIDEKIAGGCDLLLGAAHGSFASVSWNTVNHLEEFLIKTRMLKEIIPDAKILFITKDQIDFVISHWKCAFQQRNIMDICDFIVNEDEAISYKSSKKTKFTSAPYLNYRPWLYPYGLDFNQYVRKYYEYFGKDNCCIIHFDELKNDRAAGLSKILEFFTGSSDSSIVKKMIFSSKDSDTLNTNRTASEGGLRLMRLADRIINYIGLDLPYDGPYCRVKPKNYLIEKISNRINWLTVRAYLQTRNRLVVKVADLLSKNTNNRAELLKKFPDLDTYYKALNNN